MDSSSFSDIQQTYPDAELLPVGGSTCDCYRVKLYGKFHFMKRLKPELRTDPRYVSAMQKEFETGYRLDHPHLVRYVSKGEDYLLTEYVDGENLKVFTENHPDYFKSRQNADRFLSQLLDVVGYLHQHQIVHLDLKPENILITRIGQELKLADLGFCYTDTYTDTMGRTDRYAAPEQLNNCQVNATTDIYAIGKILQTLPCSYIYNKVIARCTADDPANRYQSVEELQRALKPTHTFFRAFLLIAVLGLMTLLFFYFLKPADTPPIASDSAMEQPVDSVSTSPEQIVAPRLQNTEATGSKVHRRELSDVEKQEIRKITLSIIQPVYQRKIEPVIDRIMQGDYDDKRAYITDSLDKVYVMANEEVFAELRERRIEDKYPNVSEEDVDTEIFNAIGDAMNYYSQKIAHHYNPTAIQSPNDFFPK